MKVPIILQMSRVDCGAACLAMVLRAQGVPVTLADCRARLDPGPKGVHAQRLLEVAATFGVRGRGFNAMGRDAVQQLPLPAIVQFGNDHFVVLESWSQSRDSVSIVDPARGRRRIGWPRFLEGFSGAAVVFEATSQPISARNSPTLWMWAQELRRLPELRGLAVGLLAAALFLHLLAVMLPLAAGRLVDEASTSAPRRLVDVMGAGTAALGLTLIGLGFLHSRLLVFFGSRLARALTQRSFGAIGPPTGLNPGTRDDPTTYLWLRVCQALAGHVVSMAVGGLWLVIAPLGLLAVAPPFLGIALVAAGLQALLLLRTRSHTAPIGSMSSSGQPVGSLLGWLEALSAEHTDPVRAVLWLAPALAAIRGVALVSLPWIGLHLFLRQQMSPGAVLAGTCLAAQFLLPVVSVLGSAQRLRAMGPSIHGLRATPESAVPQAVDRASPAPPHPGA